MVNPWQEATTLSPLRALSTMTAFYLLAACPFLTVNSTDTKAECVLSPRVFPVPRTVSATKESSPNAYTDGMTEVTHFYAAQRLGTAGPGASPSFCFSAHLSSRQESRESFSFLHSPLPLISPFHAGLFSAWITGHVGYSYRKVLLDSIFCSQSHFPPGKSSYHHHCHHQK